MAHYLAYGGHMMYTNMADDLIILESMAPCRTSWPP